MASFPITITATDEVTGVAATYQVSYTVASPASVLVGATVNSATYGDSSYITAAQTYDTIVSAGLAKPIAPAMRGQKWYNTLNSLSAVVPAQAVDLMDAGCRLFVSFKPPQSPTAADITAFEAMAVAWAEAGCTDGILFQEPNANSNFVSASAYLSYVESYYPALAAAGIRHWFDPSLGTGTDTAASVVAYYPGDAYVQGILLDYYCSAWANGVNVTPAILALASGHSGGPIPIGIGEFGGGAASSFTPTLAQWTAYISYLISLNCQVYLEFLGVSQANNMVSAGDFKIPGIQALNALDTA